MPAILDLSQHLPSILITVSVVLLTILILLNLRRRIARRSQHIHPRELINDIRENATTESRAASLRSRASLMKKNQPITSDPTLMFDKDPTKAIVEFEAMVRRLTAHMDTRAAILDKLIHDADERIKRIRAITADLPGASISPTNLNITQETPPQQNKPVNTNHHDPAVIIKHNTNLETEHNNNPTNNNHHTPPKNPPTNNSTHPTNKNTSTTTPPQIPTPHPTNSLSDNIYELADRGLSSIAIARDLDEPIGKIELILALRTTTV